VDVVKNEVDGKRRQNDSNNNTQQCTYRVYLQGVAKKRPNCRFYNVSTTVQ